jgi:hypothetical protein
MSSESSTIGASQTYCLATLAPNHASMPASSPDTPLAASTDSLVLLVASGPPEARSSAATGQSLAGPTAEHAPDDSEDLLDRLSRLVDSVVRVEELSRQAREAAATDLARYDELVATEGRFSAGLVEATRLCEQAETVLARAFGSAARAMAAGAAGRSPVCRGRSGPPDRRLAADS